MKLHSLAVAVALTAALAALAHAGGAGMNVEGPAKDGTYLVRAFACTGPSSITVTATAEGVVNGQRKSIPLELKPMQDGVYQFARAWPRDGAWLVRAELSGSHNLVTLATLAHNGRVTKNEFVWQGDGRHQCDQMLAAIAK
jgi:hypothetical protein